jgi:hypothetical protein
MLAKLRPHAPKGVRSQDRHLTLRFPSAATARNRTEKEMDHKHTLLLFIAACRLDVKDVESAVVCHHQRLLTPPFPRVKSRHTEETGTRAEYREGKFCTAKASVCKYSALQETVHLFPWAGRERKVASVGENDADLSAGIGLSSAEHFGTGFLGGCARRCSPSRIACT